MAIIKMNVDIKLTIWFYIARTFAKLHFMGGLKFLMNKPIVNIKTGSKVTKIILSECINFN